MHHKYKLELTKPHYYGRKMHDYFLEYKDYQALKKQKVNYDGFWGWFSSQPQEIPKLKYCTSKELQKYKVSFENNKIIFSNLELRNSITSLYLMYVMDAKGNFYVNQKFRGKYNKLAFHHSSFFAGGQVAASGMIMIKPDFSLRRISNTSGHYRIGKSGTKNALISLQQKNVDLSRVLVKIYGGQYVNAQNWLLAN